MTIKEAKEILDAKTFDTTIDAHVELTEWGKAKSFFEAYKMAKRSLEAWDKVIEDIKKKAPWDGSQVWVQDVLEIISKHLSEVENDKRRSN